MKNLSLRIRSIVLALVALLVFMPATVVTLDRAYTSSLMQAKLSELRLMGLALVSAFELDGEIPVMPELLYEEQLNLPDSGYIGMIAFRGKVVWQSASALNFPIQSPPPAPAIGEEAFHASFQPGFDSAHRYFSYVFTAEFAGDERFEPVHFYILNDKSAFDRERDTFLSTVWRGMLLLTAGLLVLLVIGMNVVLSPVRKLIDDIRNTARGRQDSLSRTYPSEFDGLKTSINQLINAEAEQRTRYKNSLGDLAHSLKTPLAVAMGARPLASEAKDALTQIDALIQRQLKRATAGQHSWQVAMPVAPTLRKVIAAMEKVHRQAALTIYNDCDNDCTFKGDKTDLLEILGNVLDNACKAATSAVWVKAACVSNWTVLVVEDDGPGISEEDKQRLLQRGERLDSYADGHGIGMAVVSDLLAIYGGLLRIDKSQHGGACIEIKLPAA
ncbi:ATP-binding protein [Alteromonas halophila]|uniref:histidine kinase n=1 Tax=Alteromonas halophila TaxID=516698 RepID=A0A918MU47_9ALTE|nr:ATP-binding protein [Alteromonas halophila]GGW75330.1 two-component sensor histidine kinase [Alteromonas halophila]